MVCKARQPSLTRAFSSSGTHAVPVTFFNTKVNSDQNQPSNSSTKFVLPHRPSTFHHERPCSVHSTPFLTQPHLRSRHARFLLPFLSTTPNNRHHPLPPLLLLLLLLPRLYGTSESRSIATPSLQGRRVLLSPHLLLPRPRGMFRDPRSRSGVLQVAAGGEGCDRSGEI